MLPVEARKSRVAVRGAAGEERADRVAGAAIQGATGALQRSRQHRLPSFLLGNDHGVNRVFIELCLAGTHLRDRRQADTKH